MHSSPQQLSLLCQSGRKGKQPNRYHSNFYTGGFTPAGESAPKQIALSFSIHALPQDSSDFIEAGGNP
jgi:hypothetical protein